MTRTIMTQEIYLDEIIEAYKDSRRMTLDFLDALAPSQLGETLPRPDLDTFGKHFQELGDTEESYALGVASGAVDFGTIRTEIDYELVGSRDRLREFLEEKDEQLYATLEGKGPDYRVVWDDGEEITLVEHLSRLVRHELFHHGQFAAYAYILKVPFPQSWVETWVLPAKEGQLYSN